MTMPVRAVAAGGLLILATGLFAETWREITLSGEVPSPRINPGATYDPTQHRMIIYEGRGSSGDLDDMWAFDLAAEQWTTVEQNPDNGPGKRYTHNMVYDAVGNQLLLWSGRHADQGSELFNDVWAFDLGSKTWELQVPDGDEPNRRYGTAAVLDPLTRFLVNFAGFTEAGRFDDTWRFDVASSSWTDVSPPDGQPGKRCLHMASYDSQANRMLIYGGQGGPGGFWDDIWALDLASEEWSDLTPEERPDGRSFPTHIYDPINHRAILFGGQTGNGPSDELWSFDLSSNTWILLQTSGETPHARTSAAAVYVPAEHRMILFGGAGDGNLNDVWSLEGLPGVPTAVEDKPETAFPFALEQSSPNPFNASASIRYSLADPAHVRLTLYDILGHPVRTLVDAQRGAGMFVVRWDGTDDAGRTVGSGVFVYRLRAGRSIRSRKLILSK